MLLLARAGNHPCAARPDEYFPILPDATVAGYDLWAAPAMTPRSVPQSLRLGQHPFVVRIISMTMNKNRIAGAAKQMVGATKETLGAAFGDTDMEMAGKVEKVKGKIQSAVGKAVDDIKHAAKP
jgi:uncharacterized protein YjbJ (UPF0337 family)